MTAKKRKAMVFGTFDFLHIGHLSLFRQAKQKADQLLVVIARTNTVQKIKGKKPIFSEKDRVELVKSIRLVDQAELGHDYFRDKTEIILEHQPDLILLGYDQKTDLKNLQKELAKKGWTGNIERAKPAHQNRAKTSKIRLKIEQSI